MLVITRKINEKITINDDIEIVILECEGNRVKLGIEAPKSVKIMRTEVLESIKQENQAALDINEELLKLLFTPQEES